MKVINDYFLISKGMSTNFKVTLKGTVSVISRDPPCNTRFTTVPLKSLSDQI